MRDLSEMNVVGEVNPDATLRRARILYYPATAIQQRRSSSGGPARPGALEPRGESHHHDALIGDALVVVRPGAIDQ